MSSRIAVVGAGIFGITAALKLAENGHEVSIIEKEKDIMSCASGINQYRIHRGYHYPRSFSTAKKCRNSSVSFIKEFSDSIISNTQQYYCISNENSLTSSMEYLDFCKKLDLEFTIIEDLDLVKKTAVDTVVRVKEKLFDSQLLYKNLWRKIKSHQIKIEFGTKAELEKLEGFDFIVVATYCNNNDFIESDSDKVEYQYELCEKPVVQLPEEFRNKGIVVLDGPFMCFDPYGSSGLHVMGNVVSAIHQTSIGFSPLNINNLEFSNLMNRGIVKNPSISNFKSMLSSASYFFEGIKDCIHIGSMFTHRVVLPNMEETDERPTVVRQVKDNLITIFSGKIPTCLEAAEDVLALVES